MITTGLLTLITLTVLIQPNWPQLLAALTFVGLTLSHQVFFSDLEGLPYHGSAALLDLGIMILISGIDPVPKMVISLHKICMTSIVINGIGWWMWGVYLPPTAYDSAFIALYAWALFTLIRRNGADVGGFTVDSWYSCFRFNWRSRFVNYVRNGGPI